MGLVKHTPNNTVTRTIRETSITIYRRESFSLSKYASDLLGLKSGDRISIFEESSEVFNAAPEWYIAKYPYGFKVVGNKNVLRFNCRSLAVDILNKSKLSGKGYKIKIALEPHELDGYTAYCLIMGSAKEL